MILQRYLAKDVLRTTLLACGVLLVIFLSNQGARYLHAVLRGDVPLSLVGYALLLEIPFLLGYLLPIAFFLAVLISYGRLYADSEMVVLHACGISPQRLLRITLGMALPVAALVAVMVFWLAPAMMRYQTTVLSQRGQQWLLTSLLPGRFQPFHQNVLYAADVASDHHRLRRVFHAAHRPGEAAWTVSLAKQAHWRAAHDQQPAVITLDHIMRYIGMPGARDYRVIAVDEAQLKLPQAVAAIHLRDKARSSAMIWQHRDENPRYAAEWQWRLAMPLSVLLMVLVALPLSKTAPRSGRFAKVLPAMVIYVVYGNALFVARDFMRSGQLPAWLGLWPVHAGLLLLAWYLWRRSYRCGA